MIIFLSSWLWKIRQPIISEVLNDGVLPELNSHLMSGFPLPLIHGFSLQNAEVDYSDSTITVCSDVAYREDDEILKKFSFSNIFAFHMVQ